MTMLADSNMQLADNRHLPQPAPLPPKIAEPVDVAFPGYITLSVDARDVTRGIFQVTEIITGLQPGPATVLYPEWLPGFHAPDAPIELLAGLRIFAGERVLPWRRDPIVVHAFHFDVPEGADEIKLEFEYLSPTDPSQGRIGISPNLLNLSWNTVVLYPAGYFARQIYVRPEVVLPTGWRFACALPRNAGSGTFDKIPLDVLIDSPLFAGKHFKSFALDDEVSLNVFADKEDLLRATDLQIEAHKALVREADLLFGARHFDRFDFLLVLSDELGAAGVEHHCSCEICALPSYFTEWDKTVCRRDTVAHEYTHSWNGKFRRGFDSWTPSFDRPIQNSLMWVYEGLTQYYGQVLAVRSGLWSADDALASIAGTAAKLDQRAGRVWRPLSDTTRDPIIAAREPVPWPSWQRSEDYYAEGQLIWLEADTIIREQTGNSRSLDDFARLFFGGRDRQVATFTYDMNDILRALTETVPYGWGEFLDARLFSVDGGAPLGGLARGGYKLIYRSTPSDFFVLENDLTETIDLSFSIGLRLHANGEIQEVIWGSAAYEARLTKGAKILSVNGRPFSRNEIEGAIAGDQTKLVLLVKRLKTCGTYSVEWDGGHRYPHLSRLGPPGLLDEILRPKRSMVQTSSCGPAVMPLELTRP